jgi:hypothetical protein
VRLITALLVCLGLTVSVLSILAQTSTRAPATAASNAQKATEPRAPALGSLLVTPA